MEKEKTRSQCRSPSDRNRRQRSTEKMVAVLKSSQVNQETSSNLENGSQDRLQRSKGVLEESVCASYKERQLVKRKAEDLQSSLDPEFPSFVKPMIQSHVSGGFSLVYILRASDLSATGGDKATQTNKRPGIEINIQPSRSVHQPPRIIKRCRRPGQLSRSENNEQYQSSMAKDSDQSWTSEDEYFSTVEKDLRRNHGTNQDVSNKCESGTLKQIQEQENECGIAWPAGNCFQCFRLKEAMRRKTLEAETAIKENEGLRFLKSCKVCMENDASMLLLPCKHLCFCKDCEPKLQTCPSATLRRSAVWKFICRE